jgi:hypothetical protein
MSELRDEWTTTRSETGAISERFVFEDRLHPKHLLKGLIR